MELINDVVVSVYYAAYSFEYVLGIVEIDVIYIRFLQ